MTPDQEREIRERRKRITKGKWRVFDGGKATLQIGLAPNPGRNPCIVHWSGFDSCDLLPRQQRANAEFIANAPADMDAILSELTRLRELAGYTVHRLGCQYAEVTFSNGTAVQKSHWPCTCGLSALLEKADAK